MKIYNTQTKQLEHLDKKTNLRLFVCGPTVYDVSHIGHARTYVFFDSYVAYLRSQKYSVFYLQNITDIDDKIIHKAHQENTTTHHIAQTYFKEYQKDMERLLVQSVDQYAKATDFIQQIQEQISLLIEKGYAYQTPSGVYYRISKFKNYGNLSGRTQDNLQTHDEYLEDKEHQGDFVIWKTSKPNEPEWDSPWGKGRPGWHIEDTAITYSVFQSSQYEVHGGARDLIFPHHEAEIALMESAYQTSPMVQLWIHTGFLNIENEKMSKSLGNFITIKHILKTYAPETLRLFFFQHHYRSPINYSETDIQQTLGLQKRIQDCITMLAHRIAYSKITQQNNSPQPQQNTHRFEQYANDFYNALNDDFNTPLALSVLMNLISHIQQPQTLHEQEDKHLLEFFQTINNIFHIIPTNANNTIIACEKSTHNTQQYYMTNQTNTFQAHCEIITDPELLELLQHRETLRQQKQYDQADSLRDRIEQKTNARIID